MKIIKIGVFILIFILLFNLIARLLWINKNSISYFYDEPKNSLDVIYVGSSNAYVHFNTILAYHLYGFTTGMLSTDSQMFALVKYLVKDAEKYQNPAVYVIDIAKVADDIESFSQEQIRKTIDSMKFSKNRIDAINEVLNLKKIDKAEYINFYFSFFMYHNRWQNIGAASFVGDNRFFKGYFFTNFTSEIKPQEEYTWNPKFSELQKENKQILMDIINYIKQSKLNVLFVVPKRHYPEEINERINDAIQIITENNLNIINFNTLEELNNIDFNTDFYNSDHLNVYGAAKYTLYFAEYLKSHYSLEDHRKDERYHSWDEEYERFKNVFQYTTKKNFEEVISEYTRVNKNGLNMKN